MRGVASMSGQFAYNLDGKVGRGQSNDPVDVQLVQFGFYCRSMDRGVDDSASQRAIYAAVKPGTHFAGGPNDPLCIAISTLQQSRGGTQDGIVSPLPADLATRYGGKHFRTLAYLLPCIVVVTQDYWPRIDKHPVCPAQLSAAVKKACTLFR